MNVRVKLPGLIRDVDRYGKVRYYVKPARTLKKVRLLSEYGSPEFMAEYSAAIAPEAIAAAIPAASPARPSPGSFRVMVAAYCESATFKALDFNTQDWRKSSLDRICEKHGDKPVLMINAKVVRALRDELRDTPSMANKRTAALRALFRWAIEEDYSIGGEPIVSNPARDIPKLKSVSDGWHTWTDEDVAAFEAAHPLGSMARLAFALMLYTGARREDAVRFGPAHIKNGRLRYRQAKNEHRQITDIDIPVHPTLARTIAASPTGIRTFLLNENGLPMIPNRLSKRMRIWCDAAGLPDCSSHGLRKATAARLAEAGATPHEIMAVTGHRSLEEVERYTKAARAKNLATTAIGRL